MSRRSSSARSAGRISKRPRGSFGEVCLPIPAEDVVGERQQAVALDGWSKRRGQMLPGPCRVAFGFVERGVNRAMPREEFLDRAPVLVGHLLTGDDAFNQLFDL